MLWWWSPRKRHNLIRNGVYFATHAANLHPELEKPGLLPPRPLVGSTYENGSPHDPSDSDAGARRPADVYLPRWRLGPPAALDVAITSGMRLDSVNDSVTDPCAAPTRYEDFKSAYKDTGALCREQGFSFIPMIMEAVGGGWGKSARCFWSELAKFSAYAQGEFETESTSAVFLQQRLSMILHRENARACLRRF